LSLRSSSSFLRLLPNLLVTSISPFIFPSITCFRKQFLRKIWQIQLAYRFRISYRILHYTPRKGVIFYHAIRNKEINFNKSYSLPSTFDFNSTKKQFAMLQQIHVQVFSRIHKQYVPRHTEVTWNRG
jgi:hypothetical protein